MASLHVKIPANQRGRDFIIGDLHGCLDLFQAQMDYHRFNPGIDRIFSVGDLADRGPDSMGCLRLLNEPWFYAVRGNHEDMLLGYLPSTDSPIKPTPGAGALLMKNGGQWVDSLSKDALLEIRDTLLDKVAGLPYVITVGKGDQAFHVAHAELITKGRKEAKPGFWRRLTGQGKSQAAGRQLITDDMLQDQVLAGMTEPLLWGRRLIQQVDKAMSRSVQTAQGKLALSHSPFHPGLSLTYVGHTPVPHMTLHASHYYLDRGAYLRNAGSELLMVDHQQVLDWLDVRP